MYKLSPSDLTFAWDGCKYCFYLKVRHGITYRGPFPGIFGKMANLTSEFYLGKPTAEITPDLPPGVVRYRERFVKSAPISIPGATSQCYIYGRFDAVIEFEDDSYGIVDYKTSDARDEHAAFYSRQLSAYAYALENPAPKALALSPVSRLGLFVITPDRFESAPSREMVFVNKTTWGWTCPVMMGHSWRCWARWSPSWTRPSRRHPRKNASYAITALICRSLRRADAGAPLSDIRNEWKTMTNPSRLTWPYPRYRDFSKTVHPAASGWFLFHHVPISRNLTGRLIKHTLSCPTRYPVTLLATPRFESGLGI